jgi:predicted Zn-ribbon and HTH transcriptional regulator
MAQFEDMTLYWKLFVCGLCGTQWAQFSAKRIKAMPKCPKCEAVTSGTKEVVLPATTNWEG